MANSDNQPEFQDLSLVKKASFWLKYHKSGVREYLTFCDMDNQTLEMYTSYRLPVPPKDEPFKDEFPDTETNPLLMEMRDALVVYKAARFWFRILIAFIFFGVSLLVLPMNPLATILLVIVGVGVQALITMFANSKHREFVSSYVFVGSLGRLDPDSEMTETFWNWKRWQKWAMARYVFDSEEELYDALISRQFAIVKSGPLNGLLVSTSTKEELPLRTAG